MEGMQGTHALVIKREAALRRLDSVTTGVAIAALAGVGVFAAISAATIPGTSDAQASTGSSAGQSGAPNPASNQSNRSVASNSGFQPFSGRGSSSGPGMVVSGGSH